MVDAVTVWNAGELPSDAFDKGVLLVRNPQPDGLVQALGKLASPHQQAAHFVGIAGEQGLGEPDSSGGQFADGIECLVAFLRLQAVDAEHRGVGVPVGQLE